MTQKEEQGQVQCDRFQLDYTGPLSLDSGLFISKME